MPSSIDRRCLECNKNSRCFYLLYLGLRTLRRCHNTTDAVDSALVACAKPHVLREGFFVGVTNPKDIIFFAAILPQFVDPSNGHISFQLLFLGLVFVGIALISDGSWALLAGAARTTFFKSSRRLSVIRGAGGVVMICLGLRLLIFGAKT